MTHRLGGLQVRQCQRSGFDFIRSQERLQHGLRNLGRLLTDTELRQGWQPQAGQYLVLSSAGNNDVSIGALQP